MTEELDRTMAVLEEKNVELAHSEKRIEENRIYLDSIINSMPSIIIGVNPQLTVTQWNKAAAKATGFKQEEACGTGLFSVYGDLEQHRHIIEESLATSQVKTFTYAKNVDGKNSGFHAVTTYPLIGKAGERMSELMNENKDSK